jgi:hypothetical protein
MPHMRIQRLAPRITQEFLMSFPRCAYNRTDNGNLPANSASACRIELRIQYKYMNIHNSFYNARNLLKAQLLCRRTLFKGVSQRALAWTRSTCHCLHCRPDADPGRRTARQPTNLPVYRHRRRLHLAHASGYWAYSSTNSRKTRFADWHDTCSNLDLSTNGFHAQGYLS